jgi:putative addiction module CopG family antidote
MLDMDVRLTPEQEAFVQQLVASGRFGTADDAVREALARLKEDESERAELIASLERGEAVIEAGRYWDYDEDSS